MGVKKLNIPLIGTFIVDYLLIYGSFFFYLYFWGNNLSVPGIVIIGSSFLTIILIHDPIHCLLWPDMIAKVKMAYKYSLSNFWDAVQLLIHGLVLYLPLYYYGVINFSYTSYTELYMKIAIDYWCITLLKDYTMMYFFHPWMHKPENYWIHKHHHLAGVELQGMHAFSISYLDAFIESDIGIFLYLFGQWLFSGEIAVNLASIYLVGWHDYVVHSLNPYSICHFNPILEYYHKPTLEHNLHHMIQKDYYVFNSFKHLFSSSRRDFDLAKYNEICKTTFCFDLWVDEDKNKAY